MRILGYEEWCDKNMDWLQEEYDEYCMDFTDEDMMPDMEFWEFCESGYEGYISEGECRAYDDYKDSLLDLD